MTYDVVVLGLGVMGSATAEALARRGLSVLGLEQFGPCHPLGSSHGETRIVRTLYADDRYIPLARRAYEGWRELGERAGQTFFHKTGHLTIAPAREDGLVSALALAADRQGVPFELLDGRQVESRYPGYRAPPGTVALLEPNAGYVTVEPVLRALHRLAREASAALTFDCAVNGWRSTGHDIEVATSVGTVRTRRLVVTAGAWTSQLLSDVGLPLQVRGVSQAWYRWRQPTSGAPCFTVETPAGTFFGVPSTTDFTLKVGGPSQPIDFLSSRRDVPLEERERVDRFVTAFSDVRASDLIRACQCLTTHAPDDRFTIDVDPRDDRVVFAAGFSGHGFKFAPAIGELVADLVQNRGRDASTRFISLQHSSPLDRPGVR